MIQNNLNTKLIGAVILVYKVEVTLTRNSAVADKPRDAFVQMQ